jgi:phage baseplate assembly protein W
MRSLYRGFSLHEFRQKHSTKLVDLDLVKMNLLTHIYTSKGERLKMTNFGTRIPGLLFEPMTKEAIDIVREDLTYVCNYDPRVELKNLSVVPNWNAHAIIATIELNYIELNLIDVLSLHLEFGG